MSRDRAWLVGLVLAGVLAGRADAQGFGADSAPLGAQAATGPGVVYLHGGGAIQGQILADNGPNGVRIRSQKSGATFVVPAVQIDSVIRGPRAVANGPEPTTLTPPPAAPPTSPAADVPATGAAMVLTLKAVRPGSPATPAPKPAPSTPPSAPPVIAPASSPVAAQAPPPVTPAASPPVVTPAPKPVVSAPAPALATTQPAVPPTPKPTPAPVVSVAAPAAVASSVAMAPPPVTASTTAPIQAPPAAPKPGPAAPTTAVPVVVTAPATPASTSVKEGLAPPPATISIPDSGPTRQVISVADSTPAPPDTAAVMSTISFISGTEIYIAAGRQDGLVEGSEVAVIRGDTIVATLRVKFLASHKSNCELIQGTPELVLGDKVRFHRFIPTQQLAIGGPVATPHARRLSGQGLHGRIGSRYLRATTNTISAGQPAGSNGFNQPSVDARLYGLAIGGTPLGLAVDLRARQTTTSSAGGTTVDGHTRAYQAVVFWNAPDAKFRMAAGRQYLTYINSIGLFDGGLVEVNGRHTSVGGFAGWEPDAASLNFTTTVHDYGLYATMHNAPGGMTATAFTIGAVGSYEGSLERREWGLAQANISNRYLSLYVLQEVDYYRPWKLQGPNAESSAFSFTSQFANVSARPKPWLSINATYDKRRNVRLIRDFTNPETVFDDAYREGYGGGVQYSGRMFYLGGDWRRSTGATVLGATSYTTTFGANRVAALDLGFSIRATWYQNQNDSSAVNPGAVQTSGHLYSAHVSLDPATLIHLDLNAGIRGEDNPVFAEFQKSTWYGVDVDVAMARQWYFSFSGLRQQDPANPGTSTLTQLYGGLTYRF